MTVNQSNGCRASLQVIPQEQTNDGPLSMYGIALQDTLMSPLSVEHCQAMD